MLSRIFDIDLTTNIGSTKDVYENVLIIIFKYVLIIEEYDYVTYALTIISDYVVYSNSYKEVMASIDVSGLEP